MLRRHTLADVVTVPTSDKPEMIEWTAHYWYVLRCGALQASASLTDAQAVDLVAWFKGFAITTPCPDCRAHFVADLAVYPFELQYARDPMKAMFWVEELRRRIELRKTSAAAAGRSVSIPAPVPAPASLTTMVTEDDAWLPDETSSMPTQIVHATPAGTASGFQTLMLGGRRQATAPMLPRTSNVGNNSMRKLAIQSAMQQTMANRVAEKAGVSRGCGCGKKKPQPKVA